MAKIKIVIPQATRNLITNPSIEVDMTGWNAHNGATLTRVVARARFGVASLQVVCPGAVINEGAYFRVNPSTSATKYIGSVYLRGAGRVRLRLKDGFNGDERVTQPIALNDDRWRRYDVAGLVGGAVTDDLRLYVETAQAAQAVTYWIDAAQIERQDELTTYCDGDRTGCRWDIVANASESVRDADVRTAGITKTLAGVCQEVGSIANDLYVTTFSGFGFAPIRQQIQEFAVAAGAFIQRTKVLSRILNMLFWAKDETAQGKKGVTLTRLHELRQTLINYVKPDLATGTQPFVIEYEENNISLFIEAFYEAGLELDADIRNKWTNGFPLRMIAVEPYWVEDNQEVATLDLQDTINPMNYCVAREDEKWNNMNFGVDDWIKTCAKDSDGRIYFGGLFTTANNNAGAIDPLITVNRICYWDGTQFRAMGAGFNNTVSDIAVSPDGTVWAVGDFTALQGGAANAFKRVAYWDWSTETWNNLPVGASNGLNNSATRLHFLKNGDVLIGGSFTADGAGNAYNYIVRWDGSSFHAIGANNGLNGSPLAFASDDEQNYVYIGGNFTQETGGGANTLNYVARFDTTNWLFETIGGLSIPAAAPGAGTDEALQMLNSGVFNIEIDSGGNLYAGGQFTDVYQGTALDKIRVAIWNGSAWNALGDITEVLEQWAEVTSIAISNQGFVYIGGQTSVSGNAQLAIWNGLVWTSSDIAMSTPAPPGGQVDSICITQDGNIYLGINDSGTAICSGITTVNNIGTAAVNPVIRIDGPCTVRWLGNQTDNKRIYLNAQLQNNEVMTIDFVNKSISTTFRGKDFTVMRSNSDFGSWKLLPGDNTIALFVTNDVDAQALIRYTPRHWSVDAVADVVGE